jgi:hypothetical protein
MSLKGIHITEGAIGANVSGDSREFAIIGAGDNIAGVLEYDTVYRFRRLADAVAIGIDANYDLTNNVHLFRHISEFYRIAGDGKTLNLMVVDKTQDVSVTPLAGLMAAKAEAMIAASTLISDIAFVFNLPVGTVETLVNGLSPYVSEGIEAGQAFAQWCDDNDMPLHVIIEGRNVGTNFTGVMDLRAYETKDSVRMDAPKVTVVIGQDWSYAENTPSALGKLYADVGTFLGCIASQAWNRNPGEVETMGLTDSVQKEWTTGGLSNHLKYETVFKQLETLEEKGYVFPIRYTGVSGYWWNGGHCCVPVVLDSKGNLNQHEIFYSHTIDQAKRALRIAFLPEVKKPVGLEEGKLGADMISYYNAIGNIVFNSMEGRGLISTGRTKTDKESDLVIEKVLKVSFEVVPTGMVNYIEGTINLKGN